MSDNIKDASKSGELRVIEDFKPSEFQKLKEFVASPTVANWAQLIVGIASSDKASLLSAAGRVGQQALKGHLFEQLGKELFELRKKGMIDDSYLESELGKSVFVDMLKFIDEENPDEIRFKAMRSIFFSSVATDYSEIDRRRAYYLFQESKALTSMDIQVLKACYKIYQKNDSILSALGSAGEWVSVINHEVGLGLQTLIDKADTHLSQLGFISSRQLGDMSGIQRGRNFRLTDGLGMPFCKFIIKFETKDSNKEE